MNETRSRPTWWDFDHGAPGARPGQVPTLTLTAPDGSERMVRFDGIEGDYLVDRKWSISDRPRCRAQIARQSAALAQQVLIATWEVRTAIDRKRALKVLKAMAAGNIKVRVVQS